MRPYLAHCSFDRPAALTPDCCSPGKQACLRRAGAHDALPQFGYRARPALACIIGARRAWTCRDDLLGVDPLQVGSAPRGAMRKEMTDDNISSVLAGMPALGRCSGLEKLGDH